MRGIDRAGFRVRGINHVVLVDPEPTDPAVLLPAGVEQMQVLIEDLDAIVRSIGDEQASLRIPGKCVRLRELARRRALLAELFDELSGLVELDDARRDRRAVAMSLAHKDVALV